MTKKLDIYEILYLVDTSFTEEKLENKIEFYRDFAVKNGSSAIVKNCGQKDLSYTVKKQTSANYIQMVYVGNNKLINLMNQFKKKTNYKIVLPDQLSSKSLFCCCGFP